MDRKVFDDGKKENSELNDDVFKTIFGFYKFLTPGMSEKQRINEFADWQNLDSRTVGKHVKAIQEGREAKLKLGLKQFDSVEYLTDSIDFWDPKRLWIYLTGICEICEWRKAEECKGKTPANGCLYYCKNCKHKDSCERERGTDSKIPKDCKILAYEFERIDNAAALPYVYAPLKYVLPLIDSEITRDNEVLEILNDLIKCLEEFLGDNFNFKYVSCVIRYAHLYNLIDHLPPDQKCVEPTENPITWLFSYSRRSLSISRVYSEKALEDVLKHIVPDPIGDELVKLWVECWDFEKDLLKAQKAPELGSVNDLLEYAKEDINIADIVIFMSHFADITQFKLRPIDIKVLQKCLCWKDYSFEKFLKKLPQLPEHFEEWFSKTE